MTHHGALASHIWRDLEFIAQPFCQCCGAPFEYGRAESLTCCTECLLNPPLYQKARAVFRYNDVSRDLVLGFKHADKTYMIKSFTPWLQKAGEDILPQTDIIAPVPLHFARLVKRRYNQSAILAAALGRQTGITCIYDLLQRKKATRPQGHLSAQERQENVKDAFCLNVKYAATVQGKTVTLIDDVYTTGATIAECSKTLLENGAAAIHILTLAKAQRR